MTDLHVQLTERRLALDEVARRAMRHDSYPLRDDPRYLDREPECIEGAIEVADHSERMLFYATEPDEIVHSWTRTFLMNVKRRTRGATNELRNQRDDDQAGLETWAGGRA